MKKISNHHELSTFSNQLADQKAVLEKSIKEKWDGIKKVANPAENKNQIMKSLSKKDWMTLLKPVMVAAASMIIQELVIILVNKLKKKYKR